MDGPQHTLEYEYGAEDAQLIHDRAMVQFRESTFGQVASSMRWAAVVVNLLIAALAWHYGKSSDSAIFIGISAFAWILPRLTHFIAHQFMRQGNSVRVRLDVDQNGLFQTFPGEKRPKRYWWSRISAIEETDYGIEFFFDNHQLSDLIIPWKAFQQDSQRDLIMQYVDQNFPYRENLAVDSVA